MWQAAATPRPSTHMPSAQHVRSVNVKKFEFTRTRTRPATGLPPRTPSQSRRQGPWDPGGRYGTTHATSRGQSSTSSSRNVLASHAVGRRNMLHSLLLPQDQFHHTPLFAGAKAYPRAAQNGPLRRESAAETTSWVPGPRNAFSKLTCRSPRSSHPSHGGDMRSEWRRR